MTKVTTKLLTSPLTQYEVTVVAVSLLGGVSRSVDTEDVAVKCHEIAPSFFSWQKHKDQINLELVRVSLSDAKKQKNGGLLSGSGREGWRLSSRGLDWIRARDVAGKRPMPSEEHRARSKAGSIDSVRRERERHRLLLSDAWRGWKEGGMVGVRAAQQVFRIDEYTTERMTAIKVARLRAMFDEGDEFSQFLRAASETVLKEERNER